MKTSLLTILSFCTVSLLSAQREVDLRVNLSSPVSGAEIHPMEPYQMTLEVTNIGTEPLLASDSLAVYLIMNGDTIPQMSGNYWIYTDIALAPQQTYAINKMLAFDNSALGAHIDLCLFARPYNAANPIIDPALADNRSCAEIDVVEPVNSTGEIMQENMQVYPNPVQDVLYVANENVTNIYVTDQAGKTVVEQPEDFSQIDFSQLQSGVYLVHITTGKGQSIRKIVKQ